MILNGRAALCAGRDDMSDEDEDSAGEDDETGADRIMDHDGEDTFANGHRNRKKTLHQQQQQHHRFNKPDQLKEMLESGSIPDAAMIHAARKRRQKAREQGQQVPNYPVTSKGTKDTLFFPY